MEIMYHAYFNSFLKKNKNLKIASARAGNVIGGGDWAKDRLIPDAVKNGVKIKKLLFEIRNQLGLGSMFLKHYMDI